MMSINKFGIATALAVGGMLSVPALGGLTELSYEYVSSTLADTDYWTVRVYADMGAGERLDAVAGNGQQSKIVSTTAAFYQNGNAGPTSKDVNCNFFGFDPDMEWDSYVTIGCLCADGSPFGANNLNNIGIDWTIFENGGTINANNGTWFVTADDDQGNAQTHNSSSGAANGVLVGQFTILGDSSSSMTFEGLFQGREADGVTSWQTAAILTIPAPAGPVDCNDNGAEDGDDIADGTSEDCNGNGVPDECDLEDGVASDCNGNSVPDSCDIADGTESDCDGNGTPDSCQSDDCNGNGTPDSCDIADGTASDCNGNSVPDSCDIADGTAVDCDGNGTPDACQSDDCNGNGTPDSCDIANGGDANGNGELDVCEYTAYRNLDTGDVYDTFDDAAGDAGNNDRIEADYEAINAESYVDFRGKSLRVSVVNGELDTALGSTMNLGSMSRLEAGDNPSFAGSVRTSSLHAEIIASNAMTIADGGSMTVRENTALELVCPAGTNEGEMTVRDGGDLDMNMAGNFTNNNTLNTYGDCALYVDGFTNNGDHLMSGHFYGDYNNGASGNVQLTANTILAGDLNNDGSVSAQAGTLSVLGDINNNGDLSGDIGSGLRGESNNLKVSGSFSAGSDSSLILPGSSWTLATGGNFDIAINDSNRLVAINATIRMNTGNSGVDTIEAMSADLGEVLEGAVSSNFAIGNLEIAAGNSVKVVDNHVNNGGNEIMYVERLHVAPGATFDGNGRQVWALEILNEGTILGDVEVIDPEVPCEGNLNGDDVVNIDDILVVLGNWNGTEGDANGDGVTNIDDVLVVISNWGACS
ncbi:MAG: hypothetical protein P8J89_07980 [Phycisphaerales bacterium]|nr:hypothetical protein [Phycisphaerales bacterium]